MHSPVSTRDSDGLEYIELNRDWGGGLFTIIFKCYFYHVVLQLVDVSGPL
jgi:hypothetical protein